MTRRISKSRVNFFLLRLKSKPSRKKKKIKPNRMRHLLKSLPFRLPLKMRRRKKEPGTQ